MHDAIKLPCKFDAGRLCHDLDQVPSALWVDHFNPADYDGGWSVVALYSPTGDSSFIRPMQTDHFQLRETPLLLQCPYFKEVIESFDCPKQAVRLLRLHAGSTIKEHTDDRLSYADGNIRLHVPIRTNPDVESYVNHTRVRMTPGECWYMNFTLPHRVLNLSPQNRLHLVIDCTVNEWVRTLFDALR